jgi:hypothetical protein
MKKLKRSVRRKLEKSTKGLAEELNRRLAVRIRTTLLLAGIPEATAENRDIIEAMGVKMIERRRADGFHYEITRDGEALATFSDAELIAEIRAGQ